MFRNQASNRLPAVGNDNLAMSGDFSHPESRPGVQLADRYGLHVSQRDTETLPRH